MRDDIKLKVGVSDYVNPPFAVESEALGDSYELIYLDSLSADDFARKNVSDLDALLVWHAEISEETVKLLKSCRVVVRYGVGYDLIDVCALEKAGIPFCNTPDYGTEEVADTGAAMIMHHVRRIGEYDYQCRHYAQGWQEHTLKTLSRSSGMTLGIIGVGRIGTALIRRMQPFGFKIIGFDPKQPSGHEKAIGYERVNDLDELLGRSDIVSIHCPANDQTRGLINDGFIEAMKQGSILVNTARGSIIDSLDPIENALRNWKLRAVALDVLPSEPPEKHPLIDAWRLDEQWLKGRLTITPHTAYYSEAAWKEMRFKAAETVRLFFDEGLTRNRIHPTL
jgi:lactate dehydrogenase-like 2-hydroxyacid dehydrogenase